MVFGVLVLLKLFSIRLVMWFSMLVSCSWLSMWLMW